ncbi:hypothetical protein [Micromonospora sp. CPCC 206061]|uniref:hypothetical protein n=1 Tax=Micromonospora sp. CPCC 206061 TaxID=3122410 RepID=UPI002FEEC22F
MRKRWWVGLVALAAALGTTVTVLTRDSGVACGCDIRPDIRPAAEQTARRFEELARADDVEGAWAMLTDGARARYGDVAGFRPVVARLKAAYGSPGSATAGDWLQVADDINFGTPSEAALVKHGGSPPRILSTVAVQLWYGRGGGERVDPEPAALDLRVVPDGSDGLRIDTPPGAVKAAQFAYVDATGSYVYPYREQESPAVVRWPASSPPPGPVLVLGADRTATGWRIGVTTA